MQGSILDVVLGLLTKQMNTVIENLPSVKNLYGIFVYGDGEYRILIHSVVRIFATDISSSTI